MPSSCVRTAVAPSWARSTPIPPCATPATRRRSGSTSGAWRSSFRRDLYRGRPRVRRTPMRPQQLTGERAPAPRLLAARLPACRPRADGRGREPSSSDSAPGWSRSRSPSSATSTSTATASTSPANSSPACPSRTSSGSRPARRPGTYRVSLDYPELGPFMDQAQERELRRELFTKDWNRAVDQNRPLLDEALDLRKRIAGMLGEPTWAHYAHGAEDGGRPGAGRAPSTRSSAIAWRDGARRAGSARRACCTADGHDGPVMAWDWRYYDDALRRTEFGVDQDRISEYLPLDPTIEGMFAITGEVFGLEYPSPTRGARLARIGPALRDPRQGHRQVARPLLRRPLPARRQVRARGGLAARRRTPLRPMASTWRR